MFPLESQIVITIACWPSYLVQDIFNQFSSPDKLKFEPGTKSPCPEQETLEKDS